MDEMKFMEIYNASRNGANEFFYNPMYRKMAYSDGVRDLAEVGCFWLLDIIGTECLKPLRESGNRMATVEVTVYPDSTCLIDLLVEDGAPPIWTRSIEYTDMPEGKWVFLLVDDDERFTLILVTEY